MDGQAEGLYEPPVGQTETLWTSSKGRGDSNDRGQASRTDYGRAEHRLTQESGARKTESSFGRESHQGRVDPGHVGDRHSSSLSTTTYSQQSASFTSCSAMVPMAFETLM